MARRRPLDPAALGAHLPRLHRAAIALCGDPDDAQDLVQETFARVLARPRRLTGEEELPYLLGALRNVFLNEQRTRARRPRTVAVAAEPLWSGVTPDQALEVRTILATVARLPPDQRDALVAVDVVGLSYAEAGSVLGVAEKTIATRVFRARDRVARAVQ